SCPSSYRFPYTTLFRSYRFWFQQQLEFFPDRLLYCTISFTHIGKRSLTIIHQDQRLFMKHADRPQLFALPASLINQPACRQFNRSEEHTSELQSRENLV